ncbi:MAG TPA: haloacid dehalogenase type II [Alphaproteobacteria bacterium]|jgi:2-haloacid dehalogenase|nr:haloacid dehalogenase type II [Alphaproteobacteria bacterium]
MTTEGVEALCFDVFGTVVDWRSSIIREGRALGAEKGIDIDWVAFTDAWRAGYQPAMEEVRSGGKGWVILDELHRDILDRLIDEFGIEGLGEEEKVHLNKVWHRLEPWPDSVAGLTRLRTHYTLATLSNGNVALLVNMAKRAGLPWDAVLGAEVARAYKPTLDSYKTTVAMLGLAPEQAMMVAAHNGDLEYAAKTGMRTAFVSRPTEYGPNQTIDFEAQGDWDVVAEDFADLATKLGV